MATVDLQTTKFSLCLLPSKDAHWAKASISIMNERLSYTDKGEYFSYEEVESLLNGLHRLLAGGYDRAYSLRFEKAGLFVDLYAHTENGRPVSRTERRERDCIAAVRLLLRSKDGTQFLNGVFSFYLHREEIEILARDLQIEYEKNCPHHVHGIGEYSFVGVSPLGYRGCNYRYLDPKGEVKAGEYVWVRMGRHRTEQIVYVDSVRRYTEESAPFNPRTVKQVLRKATKEEIAELDE